MGTFETEKQTIDTGEAGRRHGWCDVLKSGGFTPIFFSIKVAPWGFDWAAAVRSLAEHTQAIRPVH